MRFTAGFLLFWLVQLQLFAQLPDKIHVEADDVPLSDVLFSLTQKYGIQFAFDRELLSRYPVSLKESFNTVEKAISRLIKDLPLVVEHHENVFLIIPVSKTVAEKKVVPRIRISGQIVEKYSLEPLPFSGIVVNNTQILSDPQGNFTFFASADSTHTLRISHLGYYILDTLITGNHYKRWELTPKTEHIGEVVVEGNPVERSTLIGDVPGKIKLNHRIAPALPGFGDNSVFQLLRLMPGILAAGEQSADLLIWGSYDGHSKTVFDGITLFGLKNFHDDIGVVNPLVIKDMEVMKGGFDARYGDRVGGMVVISGKNGSLQKPSFTFNLNNTTGNSLVEIPVSEKSSLLAAYRQTYHELFDPSKISFLNRRENQSSLLDATYVPDYSFKDANLKYSFVDQDVQAGVSIYHGGDNYAYRLESDLINTRIVREEDEKNRNSGGSLFVQTSGRKGNSAKLKIAYSSLSNDNTEKNQTTHIRTGNSKVTRKGDAENQISQLSVFQENRFNLNNGHVLETGLGTESNHVRISRNIFSENILHLDNRLTRFVFYLHDELPVGKKLRFISGIRTNVLPDRKQIFVDPRISVSMQVSDEIKMNMAWGRYHQFLAKTTYVDSLMNFYYFWANADEEAIPVLSGRHLTGGISYQAGEFTSGLEVYHKKTRGLSRFINGTANLERGFYSGEGRSYGMDVFIRREFGRHLAWISYSLSRSEEMFPFGPQKVYRPAPHDQRHELKMAGVFYLGDICFSASYIYGSGFERFALLNDQGQQHIPEYKRLDAAVVYSFRPGKISFQAGLSVLNVFDHQNIKLSNIRRIATGTENPLDVNADAVPFTPALFLNIRF